MNNGDIDVKVTIFNSLVSLRNYEVAAIWQRYSAMLLANSIVIFSISSDSPIDGTWSCIFGILICILWGMLTCSGWWILDNNITNEHKYAESAFDEKDYALMHKRSYLWHGIDIIKWMALSVIVLFISFYVIILITTDFHPVRSGPESLLAQSEPASERLISRAPKDAFDDAIAQGRLSGDPSAENYAGRYMYMGTIGTGDIFKHIDTRRYLPQVTR